MYWSVEGKGEVQSDKGEIQRNGRGVYWSVGANERLRGRGERLRDCSEGMFTQGADLRKIN